MKASDALKLTKEAYESSSAYLDANFRPEWDYSLRAFRNEHASNSKYSSTEYVGRSKLFRPKTRSVIRKNEAAAAVMFRNVMDAISITAEDQDDPMSVAAAHADKAILDYRLTRTIPAFPLIMGAIQDAQTTGTVVSYQYWEYERDKQDRVVKDQPCIELRPIENLRLDGGANWLDPVNTSPYLFDIIPMYVNQVRAMMRKKNNKTGEPEWKKLPDDVILKARPEDMDATKEARLGKRERPDEKRELKDFDTVWVMRCFLKDGEGEDYVFYSLGTEALLTDPKPVKEVYFHGKRPYVIGFAILETHKVFKTGVPMLLKPLQQETNDVANMRLDNVKFVLNKRWFVARGRQVDVQSLVRGAPGAVTLMTNPKEDVQESNWPDVTSSAYVEQDRISSDMDDLAGNFTPNTKVANNAVNDTLGGSKIAAAGAGVMTDYLLHTIIETWLEPVLRQLLLLERYYETDEVILDICAKKARLFKKFGKYGIFGITEDLLSREVNIQVNAGSGNPQERFQKFVMVTQAAIGLVKNAPPGMNVQETLRELYNNAGYRDGARFFSEKEDPRLMMAMQQIQQMRGLLEGKQMELQSKAQVEQMKLQGNQQTEAAKLHVDQMRIQGDLRIREAELAIEQERIELEKLKIQIELKGASEEHSMKLAELGSRLEEAQMKLESERQKIQANVLKLATDLEKSRIDLEAAQYDADNKKRIDAVHEQTGKTLKDVRSGIESIAQALVEGQKGANESMSAVKTQMGQLGQGMSAMLHAVVREAKKPSAMKLKKKDGKTESVVVRFNDGSEEVVPVHKE